MTQQTRPTQWRRIAGLSALPLVGILAISGCAGGGQPAESDGDTGPVTITFAVQTQTNETKPYTQIAEAFTKENPDITVEIVETPNDQMGQVMKTQLQAGNAPDVIYGSPGTGNANSLGLYNEGGYMLDLSEYDWAAAAVPESAEAIYHDADGHQFGLPLDVAPIPLGINQTAFDEVGIEYPTTFDEFIEQCGTVRDAGKSSFVVLAGAVAPNTGIMSLELAASRVYSQDPDWNEQRANGDVTFADSDGWKQTLEDIIEMNESGCFQDGAEGGTFDTLTNYASAGQSLAVFAPAGFAADLKSVNPEADFSLIAFPGHKASDTFLFASPSNAVGINAQSDHIEAATKFLEYLAQPETQDEFASLTGNASLASVLNGDAPAEQFDNIAEYLTDPERNAPLANLFWPNGEVYNALGTGVQGLITGQATVDAVLASMDAAWDNS